jgi:hypothetical protein
LRFCAEIDLRQLGGYGVTVMPAPSDEREADRVLRLVRKAIANHETSPCFVWEDAAARTARARCFGVEPRELRRLAIKYVVQDDGLIRIKEESDEEWVGRRRFDYWCSVSFSVEDEGNVFMKIVLVNDDEDYPEARIVGAHESL